MDKLPKTIDRRKKRVGRGYGSGKGGHTSGRGQKGQKSRGSVGILFEGYKVRKSLIKRLPLRRGKGRFEANNKPLVVDLGLLNIFPAGTVVDLKALIGKKIVDEKDAKDYGIKILGNGKLEKKLTVSLPTSNRVAKEIEKLGGKVIKEFQDNKDEAGDNKKKS
jgi:large subunit ribosomal protein L15